MPSALLIDTLSIQSYIFGSNKLKENVGGSFIIEHLVYNEMIPEALSIGGIADNLNPDGWKTKPEDYLLKHNQNAKVEIGYIGGGNALLLFRTMTDAKTFVEIYSRLLLLHFPGLKTAYGLVENFNYEEGEEYKKFRKKLNEDLLRNRNFSNAHVIPLKHGIVEDCPLTNEAQEFSFKEGNEQRVISGLAWSRLAQVDSAQKTLSEKFGDQIEDQFTFSLELDKLGQPDDKGYIAIVHADGNGMGQRFMGCKSLAETRKLSSSVADYADNIMEKMIGYIISLFQGNKSKLDWTLEKDEKTGKTILPIRPLIIGGDDITFVCEGRLGVHLAEKLLEYMCQTPINGETIHACAGVAIVHTKYPFYKAYQLAKELIKRAKDASRGESGGSWLEYMISTGGFSGTLNEIIEDQFSVAGRGELKNGPYRIDGSSATVHKLHKGMMSFSNGWPRNKIKDLRDVLCKDSVHQRYFLTEMEARGLALPDGANSLWQDSKTPYYDMIEMLDFYPESLLS
jgi:hypothetical protein